MEQGDVRAEKIYETIGVYLGYGVAHYADFYDCKHVLVLGRVTTGTGGEVIVRRAEGGVAEPSFPHCRKKSGLICRTKRKSGTDKPSRLQVFRRFDRQIFL